MVNLKCYGSGILRGFLVSIMSPNSRVRDFSNDIFCIQDEGTTTVTVSGLERKDSGVYKVKAKNSQGEDEVDVRVNVIGPPDKPRGPLEVSDVRSTRDPIQHC